MYGQILDTYQRAAEATMQFQQAMLRDWAQQWRPVSGAAVPGAAWVEQARAAQKTWSETVTTMLHKHRELLDEQYKAGIRVIEDAFRTGEAKDPEQFRKLTEELWKHSFEALRKVSEEQSREFQAAMQSWLELASQGAAGKKP
jgi:hypothetical protein